jgi:hypothetical protein
MGLIHVKMAADAARYRRLFTSAAARPFESLPDPARHRPLIRLQPCT